MHNVKALATMSLAALFLAACGEESRPTSTEIKQADYGKCLKNWTPCKGKFIKFDGVVKSYGENYVRIKTDDQAFDLFELDKLELTLIGAKVTFSGFLKEHHTNSDEVLKSKIDAVLVSPEEMKAEQERIATQKAEQKRIAAELKAKERRLEDDQLAKQDKIEDGHLAKQERIEAENKTDGETLVTCAKTWKVCVDNADMANNNEDWPLVKSSCKKAAQDAARNGDPKWPEPPSYAFRHFVKGDDYPKTGIVIAVDNEVKFLNTFGIYERTKVICTYDLTKSRVVHIRINVVR